MDNVEIVVSAAHEVTNRVVYSKKSKRSEDNMLSIYTSYRCNTCKLEFVLLTEDIDKMAKGRYLACPYCNSKKVVKEKANDSLKECMSTRTYKREKGAIRQVRNE